MAAYAAIKESTTTPGTLDEAVVPKIFTGVTECGFETSQDSQEIFADNQIHMKASGASKTEGSIKGFQLPEDYLINHLGYVELENIGGYTATDNQRNFVWQYIELITDEMGNQSRQLVIFYNVQPSPPKESSKTDTDKVEAKEFEIPCSALPNSMVRDPKGRAITSVIIPETKDNAWVFDLAYKQVVTPDTEEPPKV